MLPHQFGMFTLFTHFPALYDIDDIRFFNCGQPVGHHQCSAASHKRLDPSLHQLFTLRIQS